MTQPLAFKVKWGKELLGVALADTATVADLSAHLQAVTGVPAGAMKLMSVTGALTDSSRLLASVNALTKNGLMMIGSATQVVATATGGAPPRFAEDTPPERGLVNMGNTCYLNSCVQLLRSIPELRSLLAASPDAMHRSLSDLMSRLDAAPSVPVDPSEFVQEFWAKFPAYGRRDGRWCPEAGGRLQHDPVAAMSELLGGVPGLQPLLVGEVGPSAEQQQQQRLPFLFLPCRISDDVQIAEEGIALGLEEKSAVVAALPRYLLVHVDRFARPRTSTG